eukprot:Phypoly_transcript_00532.p1 GENE.Phypoly_transcript_00532~~Phypoly_transcript_00532.p1  ORF type:complete len:1497 (+),score=324.58 Phypoly_transcript_00532:43-4533(+)
MDIFLSKCLDFIALEGQQGTTLEALWVYMARDPKNQVDNYIKAFVWDLLQQQSELEIKTGTTSVSKRISYDEASSSNVTITAPKQIREYLLGITDPRMVVNDIQMGILELVGKHREKGILQTKLSEQTGIDPRNLFYHITKLEAIRVVQRLEVLATSVKSADKKINLNTKLVILPRFAHYHTQLTTEEEYIQMPTQHMRAVCKQLKHAKDNILVESDIMTTLSGSHKRRWRDVRDRLVKEGYIQKITVSLTGPDGREQEMTAIKLLKDYPTTTEDLEEEDDDEDGAMGPVELVAELSTDAQCYKLIKKAGSVGITQTELSNITGVSRKVMASIVDHLAKVYGLYKVSENLHRTKTYRLFAQPPELDDDGIPIVPKQIEYHANASSPSGATEPSESNSLIPITAPATPPPTTPSQPPTPSGNKTLEGIKRYTRKSFPITLDARKRRKALLELLEEHKVLTVGTAWDLMVELEKNEKGASSPMLDKKTVERLISAMEKEQVIHSIRLSVPCLNGLFKSYQIIMHKSVSTNSEIMQNFITNLKDKVNYKLTHIRDKGPTRLSKMAERPVVKMEQVDRLVETGALVKKDTDEKPLSASAVALKYGFLKAKMARVKMLHNYIWGLASDLETVPNGIPELRVTELIQKFPLDLFLTVVGQTTIVPGLEDLMGRGLTLEQLPQHIQQALFHRRAFARRLNVLLEILTKLNLITKKHTEFEVFYVAQDAETKDITVNPPQMRKYHFGDTPDVMLYWTELEYIALHKSEQEDEDEEELEHEDLLMVEGLPQLQNRFSWNLPGLRLNKQQKLILDGATPHTREEYQDLANKTGLSLIEVTGHYDRVAKRMKLKKQSEEMKKQKEEAKKEKEEAKKRKAEEAKAKTKAKEIGPAAKKSRGKGQRTRVVWTPHEEHSMLKEFISEMNKTDGWSKLDTAALVPPYSAEIWIKISEFVGKSADSCCRRAKAIVSKFPEPRRIVQLAKAKALNPAQKLIPLPATVENLHKYFTLELPGYKEPKARTPSDSALPDILRIILQEPENDYNSALAMRILSNFKEEEIVENFEKLSALGYITRSRVAGISRGYQFSITYQKFFKDLFPPKLFEEENAFRTLIRMQLPKQPPLMMEDEDGDISQYLQVRQMCSGGAVSQCLKYLIDDTVKITPIVPSASMETDSDEVDKNGRGGVKDHLMLFRSQSDAPLPSDATGRSMRKLYGVSSDVIMIRQFGWKMVIEKGNSFETNMEEERELAKKGKEETNFNVNNNNNTNNTINNNTKLLLLPNVESSSTSNKRKEPEGETTADETSTKRAKVDSEHTGEVLLAEISKTKAVGITLQKLAELHPEMEIAEIEKALEILHEKKQILKADDQVQLRYVSSTFEKRWCILPAVLDSTTQQPKRDETKESVVVRPWLSLSGERNKTVYNTFQQRLLFAISKNPGICDEKLHELLKIISPVAVDELLEALIKEQKVTFRLTEEAPTPSLFSSFDVPWLTPPAAKQQRVYFTTKLF